MIRVVFHMWELTEKRGVESYISGKRLKGQVFRRKVVTITTSSDTKKRTTKFQYASVAELAAEKLAGRVP